LVRIMKMTKFKSEQIIGQLEKRKGGYFYLKIDAETINQFKENRKTRFLCTLENRLTFQYGINHFGDGNFFIILSTKNLKALEKTSGDIISFELNEDPNPLGVDVPEVLEAVLSQDEALKSIFEGLTNGKKRGIIHTINRIKDIDKQIERAFQLIKESTKPRAKRQISRG
jgi:hypothetical protein